jgi:hypothetical protein
MAAAHHNDVEALRLSHGWHPKNSAGYSKPAAPIKGPRELPQSRLIGVDHVSRETRLPDPSFADAEL